MTVEASDTWRQVECGRGHREAWLAEAHATLETTAGRSLPPLHARWRERLGHGLRILDLFDDVVCSAEVGYAKSDPEIYALACRRLGLSGSAGVFVDDHEPNVTAATAAGVVVA